MMEIFLLRSLKCHTRFKDDVGVRRRFPGPDKGVGLGQTLLQVAVWHEFNFHVWQGLPNVGQLGRVLVLDFFGQVDLLDGHFR